MKPSATITLCAAFVLAVVASLVSFDPARAGASACYKFWAEAQENGEHYRHVVYVENDCDYWLQCSLWTDEDPQPPVILTVGPGETEHAQTNEDSTHEHPKAFGTCRKQ